MAKRTLLIAFLFLTLQGSSAAVCVTKTLQFCQYGFNQNLNVTSSSADWTNPGTLSFIIRSYYIQGIDGLLAVCNARQQFARCLGAQYDVCISPLNFIASGESPQDAQAYVQLFRTMEFDCDGGFIQSSRHWGCIAAILQTRDGQLTACRQTYDNTVKSTPAQLCQASADYETCVRSQYSDTCGPEVSWWSCERTRRGLSVDEDCPNDICSLVTASASEKSEKSPRLAAERIFNREPDVAHVLRSLADKAKGN
ncbi:unnamed protein product [Caenorhabditis sp. 36 PRJEB53466]|nr:unnamed protein product [Caenorhabditis sp. 36 PRJEB53466]